VTDDPLFDFAVPEDLLREAVSQVKDADVVAELEVMPGTGEGKPPPLIGILRSSGYAPLVLLTAAALVPGTFGNGINLIGRNLETSFHMSNASLGAVAFIAQVSQLLWAVPLAVWADRGSRKLVAGVALLIFAVFGTLMAFSPNVWWFAFLYSPHPSGPASTTRCTTRTCPTPTRPRRAAASSAGTTCRTRCRRRSGSSFSGTS
jgi:hypothetical protein